MRNKNLKRFLTTASALGMIAMGAQGAQAAVTDVAGAANAGNTANSTFNFTNNNAVLTFNANHTTSLAITTLIAPGATSVIAAGVDVTLNAVGRFNSTIAATANGVIGLRFAGGGTLTLDGAGILAGAAGPGANGFTTAIAPNAATTYESLGTVDFNNGVGVVNVTAANVTFANQFDSAGGAGGTLTVTGASNKFTGAIGATNALDAINVNNNATFKHGTLNATVVTIANGKTMTIDSTDGVIGAGGAAAVANTNGAAAGQGALLLTGANNLTLTGAVGATALKQITMTTTGGTTLITGAATVLGGNIDASASTAVLNKIGGNVTATAVGGVGGGILSGVNAFTITGTTTADGNITLKNIAGQAATFGTVTTTANNGGNFNAVDAAGVVNITGNTLIDGTVTTGAGVLTIGGGGNLVATNNAANATAITIGAGGAVIAGTTTATRGDIVVNNTTGPATFTGAVTTTAGNSGNFNASASTAAVTFGAGALNTISGTFQSGAGAFTSANALTVTNFSGAVTDDAMIIGAGGSNGGNIAGAVIVAKGNLVINALAGAATNFTAGVTITNGNFTTGAGLTTISTGGALTLTAAGSKVVVGAGGLNSARAITFTNGGSIDLAGNLLQLSTAAAIVTGDITGAGTVNAGYAGNVAAAGTALLGNIGTSATAITALNFTGGGIANGTVGLTIGGAGSTTTSVNATTTSIKTADAIGVDAALRSITYNGAINGTGGNGGLVVLGNGAANTVTFNGAIGGAGVLALVQTNAGGAIVSFKDAVNATTITINSTAGVTFAKDVTGAVTIAAAAPVTFSGNVTGAVVLGAATPATFLGNVTGAISGAGGIATFGNGAALSPTVSAGLGIAAAALTTITTNLGGGKLTVSNGAYTATNTTFTTDDTIALGAPTTLSNFGTVTTATANTGTIDLSAMTLAGGHALTADVGTALKPLKEIKTAAGKPFSAATFNVYAPITGASAVTITGAASQTLLDIGAKGANAASLTFTGANNATAGNIYADTIAITANTLTAKSFNTKDGSATTLTAAASTATILDGGSIGTVASGGNGLVGIVTTSGSATLGNIGLNTATGRIASLKINGTALDKVVTLNGDVYANADITQVGSTLKVTKNTTIDAGAGAYTVSAPSAIDATDGALTINGIAPEIKSTLNVTFAYQGNENIITSAAVPVLAVAGGQVNITFVGGMPLGHGDVLNVFGDTANAPHILANGTATNVAFAKNAQGTGFVTGFTYHPADVAATATAGAIKGGTITIAAEVTRDSFAGTSTDTNIQGVSTELAKLYNDGKAAGEAATMLANFAGMNAADRTQATSDFASHDSNVVSTVVAASAGTTATQAAGTAASNVVASRMMTTASSDAGVAAGDSAERFGAWVQVIGGKGTQKMRKGVSGFTSSMMGGMFGADTMISDNVSVGMLVADIANSAKLKDTKNGGKIKSNTWMFGLYGNYDIGSTDFFVQGNLTVGQTAVDSKTKRLVSTTPTVKTIETARGKYDILGVGAELVAGYKFKFDNSYVAPTAGLRYNYFGDATYTETGLTAANQAVKTKAQSVLSALVGIRIGADVDMDGTTVKPEVHGNMSYAFNSPASKTSFKINGAQNNFTYAGPKSAKFGANFGAGVMAEADGFEYGVGYDANIADKYLAHQGSLKVKVKF